MIEKVEYVKGLADGLELGDTKAEKVVKALLAVVEEMADEIDALNEYIEEIAGQVDEIDEDLGDLETDYYELDDDDDDDCDCGCGCGCDDCDCDDDFFSVECPNCGEQLEIDESILEEEFINCPACGTKLEFAFDDCDCDCDDCDCE